MEVNRREIALPEDREEVRAIMHDALLSSYRFWCDELTGALRQPATTSFNEAMEICLTSMCKWTCIHRPGFGAEPEHWEFGAVSFRPPCLHIWVLVRPDQAESLFKKHDLKNPTA